MKLRQIVGMLLLATLLVVVLVLPLTIPQLLAILPVSLSADELMQLAYAAQKTLLAGLVIGLISSLLALVLAISSAYKPRILWVQNILQPVPVSLLLILFFCSWHSVSNYFITTAIALTSWIWTSHTIGKAVLANLDSDRISFARLAGHSETTILIHHILPNLKKNIIHCFFQQLNWGTLLFTGVSALFATSLSANSYSLGSLIHTGLTGSTPLFLPSLWITFWLVAALFLLESE